MTCPEFVGWQVEAERTKSLEPLALDPLKSRMHGRLCIFLAILCGFNHLAAAPRISVSHSSAQKTLRRTQLGIIL